MYYTYIYFNPVNDIPFYVGKGKENRANIHYRGYSTNKQVAGYIKNLKEDDIDPKIEIIYTTNETAAFWLERCFIAAYGRKDSGSGCLLNHTNGGEGSDYWKGRTHTEEYKKSMSESTKGSIPWNVGIPLSDEAKKHLSSYNKSIGKIPPSKKGSFWVNNGIEEKMIFSFEGISIYWKYGRLFRKRNRK